MLELLWCSGCHLQRNWILQKIYNAKHAKAATIVRIQVHLPLVLPLRRFSFSTKARPKTEAERRLHIMPFLRILSSLLLFCSSVGLVHAIPRPSPSTSQGGCNAPWVELGVEIFDHLPKSEGIDYCTSLLGRGTVTSTST